MRLPEQVVRTPRNSVIMITVSRNGLICRYRAMIEPTVLVYLSSGSNKVCSKSERGGHKVPSLPGVLPYHRRQSGTILDQAASDRLGI